MTQFKCATVDDVPTLLQLLPLYYACDHLDYEASKAESGLRQLISDSGLGEVWLIQDKSAARAIGYLALTFGFSLEFGGREAFVDELFILEEFRGQGLGSQAIQHAIRRCGEIGLTAIRLEVTRDNAKAGQLYQRLGFKDFGRSLLAYELA